MLTVKRQFTPYEKNQLRKYDIEEAEALEHGEAPVEYITGHVEFCGLDFKIDPRALIPRVETEELVDQAFSFVKNHFPTYQKTSGQQTTQQNEYRQDGSSIKKVVNILDIGTGSGAVAISLATKLKQVNLPYRIVASDISQEALKLAKENKQRLLDNKLDDNIFLIQADLFDNLDKVTPKTGFDLIIANLPYIPAQRLKVLESSVKDYEPEVALSGGEDGFELIEKFLNQAKHYLADGGVIFMEIDYTHPELLKERFSDRYQIKTWVSEVSRCTFCKLKT